MYIGTVFVRVTNVFESRNWYVSKLNLQIHWETDKICAFKLGETDITIVQQELDLTKDVTYNIFCDNVIKQRDELIKKGVEVSELKHWNNIVYFSFRDPDGNLLEMCSNMY